MTLASAAFGFGQPLRPNLMFPVGVLALGRVLWWIRTLHIQIRTSRDNSLHAGFLSLPVSDRARLSHVSHILKHIYTHCASWEISGAARCCRVAGVLPGCCRGAARCCRVAGYLDAGPHSWSGLSGCRVAGFWALRLPGCRVAGYCRVLPGTAVVLPGTAGLPGVAGSLPGRRLPG